MKRAAALLIATVGIALLGAGVALGAAALNPANPFNSFNIVYGVPAIVLGTLALAVAVWAWRSGRAAAPRP